MRKMQKKTAEFAKSAEFIIFLCVLCVLRGDFRVKSYDFLIVAFTADALTVERGMAIG